MSLALSYKGALALLYQKGLADNVIEHCSKVSENSVKIAKRLKSSGVEIDVDFCEVAGLIHDIGRSVTHGISHGVEGAKLMDRYPRLARICATHIGGGITKDEAVELGLPPGDYMPHTIEEKIICIADKLTDGARDITIDETLEKFSARLGTDHPTIDRIKRLYDEIFPSGL